MWNRGQTYAAQYAAGISRVERRGGYKLSGYPEERWKTDSYFIRLNRDFHCLRAVQVLGHDQQCPKILLSPDSRGFA